MGHMLELSYIFQIGGGDDSIGTSSGQRLIDPTSS